MAFFSIIIPTYNAANTIQRCLKSIVTQTDTDFEIIVQDGNSSDGTAEAVHRIDDHRIRFLSAHDTGIYDAMNKAIERSVGTWLLFLGSDDYLYDASVLADIRNEFSHTTAQLVYGDVKMVGDTPWAKDGTLYRGETLAPELFQHNYSHQAVFYHRCIFEDGHRYQTQYRICADYDFNLYCTAKYRVQYVPVTVSAFVGGGTSSVEVDTEFAKDKWMNTIRYFGEKLKYREFSPFKKAFKKAGAVFLRRGKIGNALTAYGIYLRHKFGIGYTNH